MLKYTLVRRKKITDIAKTKGATTITTKVIIGIMIGIDIITAMIMTIGTIFIVIVLM
jgi:hypothetical protein